MKTKALYRLFTAAVCAALFIAAGQDTLAQRILAPNLFVADIQGGIIYEISSSGAPTVFASGLDGPDDLAFDTRGDLFEADQFSGSVYEFVCEDGILNSNPVLFASSFNWPSGMAFDNNGNLFVADSDNIYQLAPDGTESTFAPGSLGNWISLAVDKKGDLFEAGQYGAVIEEFTPSGHERTFASAQSLWGTTALAFKENGELYAANFDTNEVMVVKAKNQKNFVSTDNPWGMVFDESGNLYVTDGTGGDVVKITSKGKPETIASNLGDPVAIAIQPALRDKR